MCFPNTRENVRNISSELHKGAKRLQCSSDFMNKIEERPNTAFFESNRLSDWQTLFIF